MKAGLACLGASALLACGSAPEVDAKFYVDPPMDDSCVGVVGFDVLVTPTGEAPRSDKRIASSPILAAVDCKLPDPFTVRDLDVDSSVTVTLTGYDGGGSPRVRASQAIDNLREGPAHLKLETVTRPPLPILVIQRTLLLQGLPLASVTNISVATQRKPTGIVTVEQLRAGPYFFPEPGAYGILDGLAPGGADDNLPLTVTFSGQGQMVTQRVFAHWTGTYYEAKQQ